MRNSENTTVMSVSFEMDLCIDGESIWKTSEIVSVVVYSILVKEI